MRKTLAWAAPLGVVALVTGGAAYTAAASSTPDLPDRSAAEILALAAEADVEQLSGSIRTNADLGLPELPEGLTLPGAAPTDEASPGASDGGTDETTDEATDEAAGEASPLSVLTRLLSGENTLDVAIDGPGDRFRADLDDPFAGATVVRDGDSVSFWSATEPDTVTRFLAEGDGGDGTGDPGDAAEDAAESDAPAGPEDLTPQEMAERFIDEADGSTEIRVDDPTVVAGRDSYVVVADPRDDRTLVDRIVLAVDAETGLPLRFQVFAVDQRNPAFETGFVEIDFGAPADEVFEDAFPEDATVTEREVGGPADIQGLEGLDGLEGLEGFEGFDGLEGFEGFEGKDEGAAGDREAGPGAGAEVVGEGWSAVAVLGEPGQGLPGGDPSDLPQRDDLPEGTELPDEQQLEDAQAAFGGLFQEVDGGRAISTALVSVLLADDGRVLIGSVPVERLVEVAAG